jgi:hypothetical protein
MSGRSLRSGVHEARRFRSSRFCVAGYSPLLRQVTGHARQLPRDIVAVGGAGSPGCVVESDHSIGVTSRLREQAAVDR